MTSRVDVSALRPGDVLKTVTGNIAEVIRDSEDGNWILVAYRVAMPRELEGTVDLCSAEELIEVVWPAPRGG
jgi:hypothetical protein